ncbi:MAG: bifunctional oligoribonuclease/PAP phosphatase NrnA [Peptococcaceae bacterium]|nr:bifunctional oligoribonuclease/PAP phosphatase NrnA [Peptococcaceae bacterium]
MKRTTSSVLKQIGSEIEKVPEAALFSHVSPDGDCLGSMLALGIALECLEKKVTYYNEGPFPENLRFLPHIHRVSSVIPEKLPKTLIFIDCAEAERAESSIVKKHFQGKNVINIDHHVSNDLFGTLNWVDPGAAATGEMVYELIKKLGIPITQEIAINLYTAIITDTGRFSYSNTTAKSFKIAAQLVKTGIDLVSINNILFEQKTFSQTKLLHKALSNLELHQNGKIAVIVLSQKDFEETGAEENLSEGLVNYARNIESVEAAALLKEIDTKEIKVSFRSNAWLDVNKVAARFGGGGHIRASGCTIDLPLLEAKNIVISALEEALTHGRDH